MLMTYDQAVYETKRILLEDKEVFIVGQGVDTPFGHDHKLIDLYGADRVMETPMSELAYGAIGVGASVSGMRPIVMYPRADFLYLALDQLVNHAAVWRYMYGDLGGKAPVTFLVGINRGRMWGAQHSQSVYGLLIRYPGLKVAFPTNPADFKGILISGVYDDDPVVVFTDKWLGNVSGDVPEGVYKQDWGKARVHKAEWEGTPVTVVAVSYLVHEALKAQEEMRKRGIRVDVIDPITLRPCDIETIAKSVAQTGRLVVADPDWRTAGFAQYVIAELTMMGVQFATPPRIVCLPDEPAPSRKDLEDEYYPTSDDIVREILEVL